MYLKINDLDITLFSARTVPLGKLFAVHNGLRPYLIEPANYYPRFNKWYEKVFWQMLLGSRSIITIHNRHKLAGFTILKNSLCERKICTFKVDKNYRNNGIASILMLIAINELGYKNISISMADFLHDDFYPIMKKFHFINTAKKNCHYDKNHSEFFYSLNSFPTHCIKNYCSYSELLLPAQQ